MLLLFLGEDFLKFRGATEQRLTTVEKTLSQLKSDLKGELDNASQKTQQHIDTASQETKRHLDRLFAKYEVISTSLVWK